MPRHRTAQAKGPPRILIEVTEEQFNTFKKFLPYGFQKQVMGAVVEDMCKMWEEFGDEFTRAMLTKSLTYKQFMSEHLERNYGHSERFEAEELSRNVMGGTISVDKGN